MEDILKNCIDSRKNAIFSVYKGNNREILTAIENCFNKMEEFVKECKDVSDFETKFASSSISTEYTELFTKIMSSNDRDGDESLSSVGDEIVDDLTRRARADVKQEVFNKTRDIPVVGEILEAKQYMDLFNKFKKKKKNND